jgi:Dolichyl-phosphate-mannose-protein mannosyltransferase
VKLFRAIKTNPMFSVLLAGLFVTYVVEIGHGLPNRDVVWGYDANPLIPLIAAKKIFLDGWNTGWHTPYPNFHCYVLLFFLTPYMAAQWLLGNLAGLRMEGGYPYGLSDFDTVFMHLAIITRLVSVAMALGTAYWVYRTGEILHSRTTGLFAACIMGFSPAIVYYVHTETVDVPLLFWLSAGLYCYVRALHTFELRYYLWLSVFAAASIATSSWAFGVFALMPLPLVARLARHLHGSIAPVALARAAFDRRHVMALCGFVVAFALAANWLWNFAGFVGYFKAVSGFTSGTTDVIYMHSGPSRGPLSRSPWSVLILGFVLGWVGFAVCLTGLVYSLTRERKLAATLLWPAAGYCTLTLFPALAAVSFIERLYLPLGLILALPGGVLLSRLNRSPKGGPRALAVVAIVAMAVNGLAMSAALIEDPRYHAERFLREHATPGARMELYGFRSELPRADPKWKSVVVNIVPGKGSDVEATEKYFNAESIAARAPDWIIVSEAFLSAYSVNHPDGVRHAIHGFLRRLRSGEANYIEARRQMSTVSIAFGFPARITPPVTIYAHCPPHAEERNTCKEKFRGRSRDL